MSHSIPASWVRGIMLVRCNCIVRGHSAVSLRVVEAIMKLLRKDCTPVIPLRGTVSASGDLLPLSYIGGAVEGSPDIFVRVGDGSKCKIVTATVALKEVGETPITLRPKEALCMINGTSASTALSSLVMYEAHQLAVLSQLLTAISVEALQGNAESFHPFIAKVRPHEGQIEVADNMRRFLTGTKLAKGVDIENRDRKRTGLYQDRYPLRSATQWIGPQLEDLKLAHKQVTTELNSTNDNPLVDIEKRDVYCGANFQAVPITSAMEKTRLALQMLGKLIFCQCTELINPDFNNGLPANLAADDPSLSFTMKGVDTNVAAYMSELAFLANPVSTHVQSAEQHNQSVNSLAFISSRYTMQAVDLVSLLAASSIYVGCQALDLRVMHLSFLDKLMPAIDSVTQEVFGDLFTAQTLKEVHTALGGCVPEAWAASTHLDANERYEHLVDSALPVLVSTLTSTAAPQYLSFSSTQIQAWRKETLASVGAVYNEHRDRFFASQNTAEYLGDASKKMYTFVRQKLGVPFHQGLVEHPSGKDGAENFINGRPKRIIGSWISIIYESLRSGKMHDTTMSCVG